MQPVREPQSDANAGGMVVEENARLSNWNSRRQKPSAAARRSWGHGDGLEDSADAPEGGEEERHSEASPGGFPKRLAALLSFCRVSTRATCELLVAMGRVTVNGKVEEDINAKVDVLDDDIVCNGELIKDLHKGPRACGPPS